MHDRVEVQSVVHLLRLEFVGQVLEVALLDPGRVHHRSGGSFRVNLGWSFALVHLLVNSVDWDALYLFSRTRGVLLIETRKHHRIRAVHQFETSAIDCLGNDRAFGLICDATLLLVGVELGLGGFCLL